LWPVYVYSYIALVMDMFSDDAKNFLQKFRYQFERVHADELRVLETITLPQHVMDNSITQLYQNNKYKIPLNSHVFHNLIVYLEANSKKAGGIILQILQTHCQVIETSRGPVDQFSFEAIVNRARGLPLEEIVDDQEGIQGAFTGVSNQDITNNNAPIKLGPLQMETDLANDVRAELVEEDAKNPGRPSLVEEFDKRLRREGSADAISRNEIPLPPSKARDVLLEVQKMKEFRDRFKIEGRTGGVGPAVSVCMFTFHNTLDS
jgi:transcription initiation factor TFIID subunit 5